MAWVTKGVVPAKLAGLLRGCYCILTAKPREDWEQVIHSLRSWWDYWASAIVFWRRSRERIVSKSFIACVAGGITGQVLLYFGGEAARSNKLESRSKPV